jgi:CRISPR-associated protein Cas1
MRKLLNTLYITNPESYLSLDGENIVVLVNGETKIRLPFVNIENIVCFNYLGMSPALTGKCMRLGIDVNFVSPSGKYLGTVSGEIRGNVTLRRRQYRMFDDEAVCLELSKNAVAAKLHNSAYVLSRTLRDNADSANTGDIAAAVEYMKNNIEKLYGLNDADSVRGLEGESARVYFGVFDGLIIKQKESFKFLSREKRPPLDNVNALLSYFYTILGFEIKAALNTVGLDPYVGFFHTDRSGRASLALDMLEELRAAVVDRFVLSLINLNQISGKDFLQKEGGGILLTDDGRKTALKSWQDRKNDEFKHPIINEKIKFGLLPYVQAQLMAKFIRGDDAEYAPFLKT